MAIKHFSDLAKQYVVETPLRPATIRVYLDIARRFDLNMGLPNLEKIDKPLMLEWRTQVLERASPTTWNNYFRHWRAIWRWALDQELVSHDPLKKGKWAYPALLNAPKTVSQESLGKALDLLEIEDALQPGWFWAIVLRLLYFSGMRRLQLVGLCWADVDFEKRKLSLRATSSKTHREWAIPLQSECQDDLLYLRRRLQQILGRSPHPDEQLLNVTLFNPHYRGHVMTKQQVSGFFRRMSELLETPFSAHRLRHTLSTELANLPSANLKSVQQLLGHTDIRTTWGYIHPDTEGQRALLEQLPPLPGNRDRPNLNRDGRREVEKRLRCL